MGYGTGNVQTANVLHSKPNKYLKYGRGEESDLPVLQKEGYFREVDKSRGSLFDGNGTLSTRIGVT